MGRVVIKDVCFGSDRAEHINYDNINSHLKATTVQNGLDELALNLGGLKFSVTENGILEITYQEEE